MLETIREYALERLAESGDARALRPRHAEHYRAVAESDEPHLRGAAEAAALARLRAELRTFGPLSRLRSLCATPRRRSDWPVRCTVLVLGRLLRRGKTLGRAGLDPWRDAGGAREPARRGR